MQFKSKIKIVLSLITTTYSALVFAQAQPRANGAALGSTTDTVSATRTTTNTAPTTTQSPVPGGIEETAPSEVTTMDPMDPARDSRAGSDATMGDARSRRARGPVSGTVVPETATPQPAPNPTY